MPVTMRADRDQVLAFRLEGHSLARRRPAGEALDVVAACGVRNSPPGSAALALHARVACLAPGAVERAIEDRTLVEVLSVRISPHVIPAPDAAVFTVGALPATEASLLACLSSLALALSAAGMAATEALGLAAAAAREELDGRLLERGALSAAMTARLPEVLCPWCKACGSRHVQESLFRLVGVSGVFVIAGRPQKAGVHARTDQWLGAPLADDGAAARTELLRRYLRCFGPSSVEHFAAWAGLTVDDAMRCWDQAADRLVPVELDGRRAWLHADDLARLESPVEPVGVRLLPPYDAYLDQRDRATLLPEPALHRRVWKILGNPGVVLADGEIAGLWRPQKKGKRLLITVEPFAPYAPALRAAIEAEAALFAPLRGCRVAEVAFAG